MRACGYKFLFDTLWEWKPTSEYENMWISYFAIIVNLLHVLVTFTGYLQAGVFKKDKLQGQPKQSTNVFYNMKF